MKDGAAYELDHLLGASPGSVSVLDIMTASGSRPLPMETDLDTVDPILDTYPYLDHILDTYPIALKATEVRFSLRTCDLLKILTKEIAATASHGAEDASEDDLPIGNHLYDLVLDVLAKATEEEDANTNQM